MPRRRRRVMPRRRRLLQASLGASLGLMTLAWGSPRVARADHPGKAGEPAPSVETARELAHARLLGTGSLHFLAWSIYEARLWQPGDRRSPPWPDGPLALELFYQRDLDGRRIAERSIEEMRHQGPLDEAVAGRWLADMRLLFPDVRSGDRITGVMTPDTQSRFFHNGLLRGVQAEAAFARRFFGIWLAPQTSEPALREQLLGRAPR